MFKMPDFDELSGKFDLLLAAVQANTDAHKATAEAMNNVAARYAELTKALEKESE